MDLSNDSAMPASVNGGIGSVDSLSLALEELRAAASGSCSPTANFLEAHERISTTAAAATDGHHANASADARDDFLCVRPAAKRSSSLKSKKTPPGTPCQVKKAVRFADAFGLDLANVKHVLDPDNPPEIPPQATSDLDLGSEEDDESDLTPAQPTQLAPTVEAVTYVVRPTFSQPGHSAGFSARVIAQKVVLESATFAPPAEIRGYVCVANLAFNKAVSVRATFDNWRSAIEATAAYVSGSSSGMTDQFTFSLAVPEHSRQQPGPARVAFCVAFRVCGQTYWDNNFGENYTFDCVAASTRGP